MSKIIFDPVQHKYTDELDRAYISATQLLGLITPEFNSRYWLMYKALQAKGYKVRPDMPDNKFIIVDGHIKTIDDLYNSVKGVLARTKIQEIEAQWELTKTIACDRGNEKHNYLEDCINKSGQIKEFSFNINRDGFAFRIKNKQDLTNSPLAKSDPLVYDLLTDYIEDGWTVYAEKRIHTSTYLIAGTIDIFLLKGNKFRILDWKTNKDELHFTSGYYKKIGGVKTNEWVITNDRLKNPLEYLQNCKGVVYTLQLSEYAFMAELFGYECDGLQLCHFGYNSMPKLYDIPYKKEEVKRLFEWKLNGGSSITVTTNKRTLGIKIN